MDYKTIGWRKLGGSELNRRPDILIRKKGKRSGHYRCKMHGRK